MTVPPSDQERVRDYHATQTRVWITFACQAETGADAAYTDWTAVHHAREAAHWSRLAELTYAVKEHTTQARTRRQRAREET